MRAEIETIFRRLLTDNSQAWTLAPDGSWTRVQPDPGERRRASQLVAMRGRVRAAPRVTRGLTFAATCGAVIMGSCRSE